MADNNVRIKLSLDGADQVKSGLAGVGEGAGTADSKLQSLVGKGLRGAGVALVGLATGAAVAGGALTKSIVDAYAAYEQNVGGIETMFGAAAGTMQQYAQEAYRTAGLSANEYMSQATMFSASLLQGLGGDTAAAAEYANMAMTDMSDNANKFGTDIGSIQNAYQGFAKGNFSMLDNLRLGYGGTREEMARLVNDAGLMEDGFVASASNIDEVSFDQIIASINAVQTNLGIAGTTAAEATQTISGSVGMLKGAWDNLLVGLGSADADVATLAGNVISSFETVVTNIVPVIQNIGTNIATLGPQLGSMGETLVGAISSAIPAVLSAGTALIGGLIAGISSSLPGLITALVPGIVGLVGVVAESLPLLLDAGLQAVVALGQGIMSAIPTLIPLGVTMLLGLIDAIVMNLPMLLTTALDLINVLASGIIAAIPTLVAALPGIILGIVNFLVSAIPQIIQTGVHLLVSLITALPQIITTIVAALPTIISAIITGILGAIPQLIQAGITLLVALVQALPQIISTIIAAIPQIIRSILSAITSSIPQIISAGVQLLGSLLRNLPQIIGQLVGQIPSLISALVNALGQGVGAVVTIGGQIVQGLWNGISGAAGWLMGKISGFVNSVMANIGSFFGISSPSKRMRDEIGAWLPSGIGEGVEDNTMDAIRPITRMNKKVMAEASSLTLAVASPAPLRAPQTVPVGMAVAQPFQSAQRASEAVPGGALSRALAQGARINPADMDRLAAKVAQALLNVRRSDGRDTMQAIRQGAL